MILMIYHLHMTAKTLLRVIKVRKPAVIRERGEPRYVLLDWKTYRLWYEEREDREDAQRLMKALADPQNKKRVPFSRVN